MSEWTKPEEWIQCPHCGSDDAGIKTNRANIRVECPECGESSMLYSTESSL